MSSGSKANRPPASSEFLSRRESCRVCRGERLKDFLSLGEQPLANHFLTEEELSRPELLFRLSVCRCEGCGLVQLLHVVDPEVIYQNYAYFSSASQPLLEHFSSVSQEVIKTFGIGREDLVCEIGSNDGVFLRNFLGSAKVVGVDPAKNIAAVATERGIPTLPEFFTQRVAQKILRESGRAKLIFAANVFASIDDLDEVMKGVDALLEEDGVFVLEVHRFADMLATRCFDQIYHEHLSFFTLRPLEHLMGRFGMRLIEVKKIPVHGESFHIVVAREKSAHAPTESVEGVKREEVLLGLDDGDTYLSFAGEVEKIKGRLHSMVSGIKAEGGRIVGYGAPGKGNILLSYCGIDNSMVDYLVDTTVHKQGLFTPGTRVPIHPLERLYRDDPDYILLLAWNYADYILEKEQGLISKGVKFIVPIPELSIVSGGA